MNKFKYYFILLITTISLFSCSKNDSAPIEPPRDYAAQYAVDIVDIEEYLNTNYITVIDHPGFVDDQNVTIAKIDGAQPSIMSYTSNAVVGSTNYPQLWSRDASMNGVTYKLYYLILRPGVGTSPCNVDGVMTSYRGDYLSRDATTKVLSTTKFDENIYPQTFFQLFTLDVIPLRGWSEILPQFKTGTYTANADGTVSHYDFGSGVMFLPSGYGYYNNGSSAIPAYSPLVFSFKLYEIQRSDLDNDGILSYQEDLDGDGYMYDYSNLIKYPIPPLTNPDDFPDKDGIPNFLDVDDDGDNYTTKIEIKNPVTGLPYPFTDIPKCTSGKKNYLDATCH